jgi:2-aminomuconate deaminase
MTNKRDLMDRGAPTASKELSTDNSSQSIRSTTTEGATIQSQRSPEPVGAYPHAKRVGDLLFLAGMGPRVRGSKEIPGVTTDSDGKVKHYDIELQTRSVLNNIKTVLEDAGSSMDKIVDIQVFLTDIKKDFKTFNQVYSEYFNAETGPTRTTVEIDRLPTPIAIELKVIARV